MFPVSDPTLTFGKISDYWSRGIQPFASKQELLSELERAWWLGEIPGTPGNPDFSRLNLLKKMFHWFRVKDDLGIEFLFEEDRAKSRIEMQTDGSAVIDRRLPVYLPSANTDDWNEDLCDDAFRTLAETSSTNSYSDLLAVFMLIKVNYHDFFGWIAKRRYARPTSWSPPLENPKRGRPPKYDWTYVESQLKAYVSRYGSVKSWDELLQKCGDFADRHPDGDRPSDKTIREAIKKYALDVSAGLSSAS